MEGSLLRQQQINAVCVYTGDDLPAFAGTGLRISLPVWHYLSVFFLHWPVHLITSTGLCISLVPVLACASHHLPVCLLGKLAA